VRIRVLLFASLRERAGTDSFELDLPAGATVASARAELVTRYPDLFAAGTVAAAVNGAHARDPQAPLRDGDELAFLPPVSGG
jgi:MoaE-MoaD fusion protein